ncbi:uncharacterized protein [Delphinus delphis]|uniref:uncharacterized protein isoform X1 n=1 Tax=Delphinus delphis TaxID=9728 RepID=UPI0037527097
MFTPWGGSFSGLLREDQGAPVHRPSINLLRFASASDSCCFLGESKLLGDREGLTFGGSSGIPLAPDHENIGSWRYQPTWDDCQQLLQTLLTTEERQRVLLEAKKNVLGANGQPTQLPNEIDAGFPLVRPNWDFNAPEGRERLKMYLQALVAGLHGAARRPTNLAKAIGTPTGPKGDMVPTRRGLPTGNTGRNSSFPSRRLRIRPSASNPDVGTSMERTIHRPPHHPNGHKSGRHRCLDSCFTRESCTSDGIIRMAGPKNRQPAQTQASTNLRLIILILLPLLTVSDFSPHLPQRLTWQVISQTGDVTWSISHTAPPWTWWPDLFPDVCKLAIGAPYWDLEGYYDQHNAPSELLTRADYSGEGCKNQVRRSWLRTLSFYVCPGFHRPRSLNYKCGGTENFYCQNWGCETTGDTYWRPTSTWDFITVTANYTHTSYRGPQSVAPECSGWCHPLKISFSNPGKRDKEWINGHSWGIRFYKNGYDLGILMTLKLKIETPAPVSIGPNPVLGPALLPPNPVLGPPTVTPSP